MYRRNYSEPIVESQMYLDLLLQLVIASSKMVNLTTELIHLCLNIWRAKRKINVTSDFD